MTTEKTIYFANDYFGEPLKEVVKAHVEKMEEKGQKVKIVDLGSDKYFDAAAKVGRALGKSTNKDDMGVLVCGTGMGVGIVANKFTGVRAATCENLLAVRCARACNDANVLCLGQVVTKPEDAKVMAEEFLFNQDFVSPPVNEDGEILPWWNDDVAEFLRDGKEGILRVEMEAKES